MNKITRFQHPSTTRQCSVPRVQFEVTTRCNFKCIFCAGREMRQGDMSYEDFCQILERHVEQYGVPKSISLQGEGEPTLNRDFFRMARLVRSLGAEVYTITNGSYKHPEHFAESFNVVGISVDSLDPATASSLGRINLPGTLHFIQEIAKHVRQINIHSIYLNDETRKIADWCTQHGYRHVIQPLQTKDDYRKKYQKIILPRHQGDFHCPMLTRLDQRYYNLDKLEMPCSYIKDTSSFRGIHGMIEESRMGRWPVVCAGCAIGSSRRIRRGTSVRSGFARTNQASPTR